MFRKRFIAVAAATILSLSIFAGCSTTTTTQKYKDGTYKAEYDKFDSHSWKAQVAITVSKDKITTVVFDYVNKDGKLKTQDEAYKTAMDKQNHTYPAKYTAELDKSLIDTQDVDKVAAISGATSSSNNFKTLSKAALEKAAKGDTTTAVVPLPAGE